MVASVTWTRTATLVPKPKDKVTLIGNIRFLGSGIVRALAAALIGNGTTTVTTT